MALHLVLVHPEIHWNTGNAGRTALAVGATLHLVEPLGFSLADREVKRAGLDYWPHVDLRTWTSWEAFEAALPSLGAPWFFDEHAPLPYWEAPLAAAADVVLLFGREKGGFAPDVLARYPTRRVRVPMDTSVVRSLNLSTTVALAAYEVLRQRAQGVPHAVGPTADGRSAIA
jgi:tRNA (cytidine/uridine-2'-O-)-methyltransferase